MKITCQACQAKYTIADEKVVGKVVKIRCKKCGATIVVNGNEPSAGSLPPETGDGDASQGSSDLWTVNVAEGDQRTMTEAEVVAAFKAGVVTGDTFCWKDGMADWLPVVEIEALHAACTVPGAAGGDFPEKGQEKSQPAGASAPPPPRVSTPPALKDRNGSVALPPTAARRAGGRSGSADLFRGAAQAGADDEVMTSAPPSLPHAHVDGAKTAAARVEHRAQNDASSSRDAPAPSMTATTEASGLIDIRQLGAQMRSPVDEKKKTRIDDIMNIGGGGGFSPSLAAPVLTAPSLEHYSQPPPGLLTGPAASQAKNKALLIVASCAGVFFLVAAVGVVMLLFRTPSTDRASSAEERDHAATSPSASAPVGLATGASAVTGAASATGTGEAPQTTAARTPEAAGALPAGSASASPAASAAKEAPAEANAAPHAAAQVKAYAAPAPREAPAAPSGASFNMGEARSRLATISGGVQTCKRGDTSGSGRVVIVFGSSGAAQSATLMGGSPFDGTPTGKCVEARFRQAHVPAFSGDPVSVTKSFSVD